MRGKTFRTGVMNHAPGPLDKPWQGRDAERPYEPFHLVSPPRTQTQMHQMHPSSRG